MNDKGFTVIEVIVAIIILSVGILGLASSAATVTRMIGQGQRFSEASAMASERFEILRAQQCEDMDGGDETKGMFEAVTVTGLMNVKQMKKNLYLVDGSSDINLSYALAAESVVKYQKKP